MVSRLVPPFTIPAPGDLDPELRQACVVQILGHSPPVLSVVGEEDLVPYESNAALPELDDDDVIADGGTEVMRRDAVPFVAAIPPAPKTSPMLAQAPDDHEREAQLPRIERTQPFDRASLFGAQTPSAPVTRASAPWQVAPPSVRQTSVAPVAMDMPPPSVPYSPPVTPLSVIALVAGGALAICAAVIVTLVVRSSSPDKASVTTTSVAVAPREAQPIPARAGELEETAPTAEEDNGTPVISAASLPSAPYPQRTNASSKKRTSGR